MSNLPASLQTLVASAFFACCSRTSVACVLSFRDHRIEFAIVQLSNKSTTFPQTSTTTASCAQPGPLLTARPRFQRRSAGRVSAGRQVRVRTRAMVQVVVVLEVAGRLRDVVHNLDRAIHLALADAPRGVVCDLSAVPEGAEPVRLRCWRRQVGTFATARDPRGRTDRTSGCAKRWDFFGR
jgi:hypothetical protein